MKKILLILLLMISTVSLLLLLAAYPRFTDDKELIFEPIRIDLDYELNKKLLRISRDKENPIAFDESLQLEMEQTTKEVDFCLVEFGSILVILERIEAQGTNIPKKWKEKEFLDELFIKAIEHELNWTYTCITQEEIDLSDSLVLKSIPKDFGDNFTTVFLDLAELFTFQKNRTLNGYWQEIRRFESEEDFYFNFEFDPRNFGYQNFFGKYLLACSIPSVQSYRDKINAITSNKASEGISRSSASRNPSS